MCKGRGYPPVLSWYCLEGGVTPVLSCLEVGVPCTGQKVHPDRTRDIPDITGLLPDKSRRYPPSSPHKIGNIFPPHTGQGVTPPQQNQDAFAKLWAARLLLWRQIYLDDSLTELTLSAPVETFVSLLKKSTSTAKVGSKTIFLRNRH